MRDIQIEKPMHEHWIDRVGIDGLRYPIKVLDRYDGDRATVGEFCVYVDLPGCYRGTHMSRFVEIIEKYRGLVTYKQIEPLLADVKKCFKALSSGVEIHFPYFIRKKAPSTGKESFLDVEAFFIGTLKDEFDFILGINVPVLLFCPCSQVITYGKAAHNQRAYAKVMIRYKKDEFVWIEELVDIVEYSASSPVRALLKRADEKELMESASKNPAFVEDCVRNIANNLLQDKRIIWFSVKVNSIESIHAHNAFASLERWK